ncbi:MAG: family 10 glycosylhydrolase [bacterium]|nr:family 10 glycosylhydrolase [bacterium]
MRYFIIILTVAVVIPVSAPNAASEARGRWVCPWDMNTPEKVDEIVNLAVGANFNTLFFECRYRGDALYVPNKTDARFPNPEPRSPHIGGPDEGDFDPLGELVTKGHRAGLEIHAWVTVYVIANEKTPTGPGHPLYEHPEWLSCNEEGKVWDQYGMAWLDPGVPEVNDYLHGLFLDIAANYDVDGIHLDYVRYSGQDMGYNPRAVAIYETETGETASNEEVFAEWRRNQITSFIGSLYRGLIKVRPDCQLTAAVFASRKNTAYNDLMQDWGEWGRLGIVDAIVPMAYSKDVGIVSSQIEDGVAVSGDRFLYAGLGLLDDTDPTEKTWDRLLAQISASRRIGSDGIAIFSATGLNKRDGWIAKKLVTGPFRDTAALPAMSWKGALLVAGRTQMKIRSGTIGGGRRYYVEMKRDVPRKYAFLYAKEVSGFTAEPVSISRDGSDTYRVLAGNFGEKEEAHELVEHLSNKGY